LPELLRTGAGRRALLTRLQFAGWPVLHRAATWYRRRALGGTRVVAVVGSFGKTTTARAVNAALGLPENPRLELNAFGSLALNLLGTRPGAEHRVLEVGIAEVGQMAAYADMVRPDVTVVTCVGSEHHRSLRTLAATRAEKSAMVNALSMTGTAVLNADDANVLWMAGSTRARVITFGMGPDADVRATDVALDWPYGTRFRLLHQGRAREVRTRLFGRHHVYPILAAVAAGLALGLDVERTLPVLTWLAPSRGRLQLVELADGVELLRDDHKSTLETVERALDLLAEIPGRRRLVVLGEVSEPPGSQGPIYRGLGARVAALAAGMVVLGGTFQRYAAGATAAGMPRNRMVNAGRDVLAAAAAVRAMLAPGDVVLVKGRDTQRLGRVSLALGGRQVGCTIPECSLKNTGCDDCPMLARGWQGRRPVGLG
jgi:UDP-N-acetylmuramoyl-tripeptide--D-alanyl-D-alanine ligase